MIVFIQAITALTVLVVSVFWTSSVEAMIQERTRQARLELNSRMPIKSTSLIRVRIFPHFKNYRPHGIDRNKTQLSIHAEKGCRSYQGRRTRPGRLGKVVATSNSFRFSADTLKTPVWLECNSSATLIRESENPHFSYPGKLYVRGRTNSQGEKYLEVINMVSLNQYLKGVVPSEVYSGWPIETLRTQAVAARTYAVFHISNARRFRSKRFWDVDDSITFQAYTGVSLNSRRTNFAVESTLGQILTYKTDVIQAYYHADSGGQTEDAVNVWNFDIPYVQGRKEAFDFDISESAWRKEVPLKHIASKLSNFGVLGRHQKLVGVAVPIAGRSESGRVRVVTLRLKGENQFKNIPVETFKKAAGRLPSTLFALEVNIDSGFVEIKGLGSGHGVGMSQQGAAILAGEQGWTYDQILNYYYIGTSLCKLQEKTDSLPNCYAESERKRLEIKQAKISDKQNAS